MEMFATARSLKTMSSIEDVRVSEAEIDRVTLQNFASSVTGSQPANGFPLLLLALCGFALDDWQLMTALVAVQSLLIFTMYLNCKALAHALPAGTASRLLWIYEVQTLVCGGLWAAMMLPVAATLGQSVTSMFVCVIILVTAAITCMITANQRRFTLLYLAGFQLVLIPQTAYYIDVIGPIPFAATVSLIPALILLTNAVRRQVRLSVRTQSERQVLADRLSEALHIAEYVARRDSLTGLLNRRAFEESAIALREHLPADVPMSLILLDLDHFKAINDKFGHATGDLVLKGTAELIVEAVGATGGDDSLSARWGGEEFLLLLRHASLDCVCAFAEDLRARLAAHSPSDWPSALDVSGSFGIAPWAKHDDLHYAIGQADAAMYRAKMAGRNRVCHGGDAVPDPEFVAPSA